MLKNLELGREAPQALLLKAELYASSAFAAELRIEALAALCSRNSLLKSPGLIGRVADLCRRSSEASATNSRSLVCRSLEGRNELRTD